MYFLRKDHINKRENLISQDPCPVLCLCQVYSSMNCLVLFYVPFIIFLCILIEEYLLIFLYACIIIETEVGLEIIILMLSLLTYSCIIQ